MPKYLDLEGLQSFKTKQDAANAAAYAAKSSVPTKVSQLTNDSGYQTSSQVASAISSAVASAYKYKGSKATTSDLPTEGNVAGDVWNVESDGMNYAWTGSAWDALGSTVDLSGYSKTDHTHAAATTSAAGFMSAADKSKLDGIATGATKVTVDSALSSTSTNAIQNKAVYTALSGKSDTSHTHSAATASAAGFLSATDKSKLDGIASGAEVNQNAFANITVGSTTIAADSKTDTLTIAAGSNVTITPDATNDKLTIAATDTTYSAATASASGLMSSTDKTKLDGIAEGANNYALPTATSSILGGVKIGSNITNSSGTISLSKTNVTSALGYTPPTTDTTYSTMTGATSSTAGASGLVPAPAAGKQASFLRGDGTWVVPTDTTYSVATTSANGLMSSTDKSKLDGIAAGANNYSLPTASSSTLGGVKTTSSVSSTSGLTACPIISGVPYYKNTTYAVATTSANGLMSSTDKTKLDDIVTITTEEIDALFTA